MKGDRLKYAIQREGIWGTNQIETKALVSVVARTIRELLLPEYTAKRPRDRRLERAVELAEKCIAQSGDQARAHAAALAKACTAVRRETFGHEHRIAEAVRALVIAVTRKNDGAMRADLVDGLDRVEEHLNTGYYNDGVYGQEPAVRARILAIISTAPGAAAPHDSVVCS